MGDLTSYNGAVILEGDDLRPVIGRSLLVENGCILAVGDGTPDSRQVDLSGKLLCPMFIDAHTHVGDTGAKELGVGLPLNSVVTPPDGLKHRFLQAVQGTEAHLTSMRHGLLEMLYNGIIALADFREQGLPGVRALRQAAAGLPVQVIILGRMSETNDSQEIEAEAHALLQEADGLGVRDLESYPIELLKRLRAAYPQKIMAAHAAEDYASELRSRTQTGVGQAARLLDWQPDFLVHLTHALPEELQRLASAGIRCVACPRCNGILGDGQPRLADWLRCGLKFALGTDNVMFTSPDMLRELDFASRLLRGQERDAAALEPRLLLKAATLEGARALHLDDKLGSLAPGKQANFIAFDLHSRNLEYQQDVVSAIVHRACTADIAEIYIRGDQFYARQ
ncbi:MAG: amidohydrolase family protein [Anaerolineaceae bacterium]|nr:amidohydrolase family protein [Anaerolineaceae bacterium]